MDMDITLVQLDKTIHRELWLIFTKFLPGISLSRCIKQNIRSC